MIRRSLLLAVVGCLGCGEAAEVVVDEPPAVSTDFARLPDAIAGIQKTGEILIFPGLPSEFWEPQRREQELARNEILDVRGHPVYDEPISPSAAEAAMLTNLLAARDSYRPYSSRKKCGGFSAEFCISWTAGEATTDVLISLECGEVKIYSPQTELHCDITPEAVQKLKPLLTSDQKR